MQLKLEKKVVLVTGGTKGIGRAIVKAFLDEGAIVHFCSRTKIDVNAATESLSSAYPSRAIGSTIDVSNQQNLSSWVLSCAEQSGGIDVVVSNVSALVMQDTVEDWTSTFNTDMLALVTLVNTAMPYLERSKGSVVAISSVSGRDVDFTAPGPYGALKASIVHYIAQLAHTLAPRGVRANTVSPGNIYIEDGVWGGIEKNNPDLFQDQLAKNPMGRMGKGEEIADSVLFLASERASFVSGTNLTTCGISGEDVMSAERDILKDARVYRTRIMKEVKKLKDNFVVEI